MPSKSRFLCMDKDDILWQKLDETIDEWDKFIRTEETYRAVGNLILTHKDGKPELMHAVIKGGYNVIYRLEYKDGSSVIMRIPIKGVVPFPDEKVRYEVATMRYIAAHTTIPIPHIYHYATGANNPTGLGPFIIMDYIQHDQNMSRALLDPERAMDERPILNPRISDEKLEFLYAQMANILLQVHSLEFPRIGSLVEGEGDDSISIHGRPLIVNMNDMVVHTDTPPSVLTSQTYDSGDEWYIALADMHMAQLVFQRNDAVQDEEGGRDKYVARHLFRNLAIKGRLSPKPLHSNSFRLFSEDFRPANVLLDSDLRVVGVIDWEFAYAAPEQFSFDPPWWLLLEEPEYWEGGYQAWMEAYEPRLETFLRALQSEEKKMTSATATRTVNIPPHVPEKSKQSLSQRMQKSWQDRTWMLQYAARKSWSFDYIWWKFLDEKYFGSNENQDYQARLGLLSEPQKEMMDFFVTCKVEDGKNGKGVGWAEGDSTTLLAKLLA